MTGTQRVTLDDLIDLHRAVLVALPLEGSTLGYHPLAKSMKRVTEELNAPLPVGVPRLRSGEVAAAARRLRVLKLANPIRIGGGLCWQATQAGKDLVADWTPPTFNEPETA